MSKFNFVKAVRMVSMHSTTKLVGLTLATYADYETGECYPTIETLMADTGLSNRVVGLHIKELESMGFLSANRLNGRNSYYCFDAQMLNKLARDHSKVSTKAMTQSHQLRKVTSDSNAHTSDFNDIEPVTLVHKAVTQSHTNSYKQPIEQPIEQPGIYAPEIESVKTEKVVESKSVSKPKVKPSIKTDEKYDPKRLTDLGCSLQLAQDFIVLRKIKKSAITDSAINLLVSQARKAGIELTQAIEICIARNWVSFNASWKWQDTTAQPTNKWDVLKTNTNNFERDVTPPKKSNDYLEYGHA